MSLNQDKSLPIDNDYRVLVSSIFKENENSAYNLRQFEGKRLILPQNELYYPAPEYFKKHRELFGGSFL